MSTHQELFHTPIISHENPAIISIPKATLQGSIPNLYHSDQEAKIHIPSSEKGVDIAGLLNIKKLGNPSQKIALILHGILAHKNQSYHRELSAQLPIDSFRFDFRGNGETGGEWKVDGVLNDLQDIRSVIKFLQNDLGYEVDVIIAHSRGALAAWTYFSSCEEFNRDLLDKPRHFVSLSSRWDLSRAQSRNRKEKEALEKDGVFRLRVKVSGELKEFEIQRSGVERFSRFPIHEIVKKFPAETKVLIVHGKSDDTVPLQDSFAYVDALQKNPKQNVKLHLVEDADHMFRGHYQEVANTIRDWYHVQINSGSSGSKSLTTREIRLNGLGLKGIDLPSKL